VRIGSAAAPLAARVRRRRRVTASAIRLGRAIVVVMFTGSNRALLHRRRAEIPQEAQITRHAGRREHTLDNGCSVAQALRAIGPGDGTVP
jgi:hypothetical protein